MLQINNGHNMLCTHSILQVTMKRTLKQKKSFRIHAGSTLYMIEEKRFRLLLSFIAVLRERM
jgi:hypothetical protein